MMRAYGKAADLAMFADTALPDGAFYLANPHSQPLNTGTAGGVTLADLERTMRQLAQHPRHTCRTCGQTL